MAKWAEIKCERCAEQDALWEGMERALEESDAREARLEAELAKANANHEHFEREWYLANDRIEELEANLAKAMEGLEESQEEIDNYIRWEYPSDHTVHERYRQRDFAANPARIALAELHSDLPVDKTRESQKGQDDEWKCPINYTGCTKNCGSYGCGN